MTSDNNPTGLRRIDDDRTRTHGWQVQIQRRKRQFTGHFSDIAHGGKDQAHKAALDFLNEVEKTQPGLLRNEYASILRRNNTSGVPGVCKYRYGNSEYWVAFWPTAPGKRKQVKFSIAKYGEKKAFELAVAERRRALENLNEPFTSIGGRRAAKRRDAAPSQAPDTRIKRVSVQRYRLRVELQDERIVSVPLSWFPKLREASLDEREKWTLGEGGDAVVWPDLGLSITAGELLRTS
jgi:hypothetical protein